MKKLTQKQAWAELYKAFKKLDENNYSAGSKHEDLNGCSGLCSAVWAMHCYARLISWRDHLRMKKKIDKKLDGREWMFPIGSPNRALWCREQFKLMGRRK